MTEPTPPRPPRRSNADYRWSRPKIIAFLKALPATLSVAEAARSVGMSRQSAYRLRARLGPGFGAVWDDGLTLGLTLRRAGNVRAERSAGMVEDARSGLQGDPQSYGRRAQGDAACSQVDVGGGRGVSLAGQGDTALRPSVALSAARVALAAAQAALMAQASGPAPRSYGRRPQGDA